MKIVQVCFNPAKEMGCGEKMEDEQKITQKSYREAVVDILCAGFCHTGICQIHLIKNNGL